MSNITSNIRHPRVLLAIISTLLVVCILFAAGRMLLDAPVQAETKGHQASPPLEQATRINLRTLQAEDIDTMELFRRRKVRSGIRRSRTGNPFSEEEIAGILYLYKNAHDLESSSNRGEPHTPDLILVIKTKKGGVFEIKFNSRFTEPFGKVKSKELKEVLYTLSSFGAYCTAIHFDGKNVIYARRCTTADTQISTENYTTRIEVDKLGQMQLYLKIRDGNKVLWEGTQPMRYGQAKIFPNKSQKKGHLIVLLQIPDSCM